MGEGDLGVVLRLLRLGFTIGVARHDGLLTSGLGLLDGRVGLDLGALGLAQGLDVAVTVDDLLDVEDGDLAAEAVELGLGLARHLTVELVALGQDRVHVHLADDDAQVPLEGVLDGLDELGAPLDAAEPTEALRRHLEELLLVGDVARGVGVDADGDAVLVGDVVELETHLEGRQVEAVEVLDQRDDEDRSAGDDARSAAAVQDEGLLGRHLHIAAGPGAQEGDHSDDQNQHHERGPRGCRAECRRPGPSRSVGDWASSGEEGLIG